MIGVAPIAIRLSEVGPHATNLWRFLFALPILAAWAANSRPIPSARQTLWLVGGGLLFGLEISLWAMALNLTTITNATLLVNLTPVFAAIFGWLWLKERLSLPILGGGALALVGAVTLALARAQSGHGPAEAAAHGWIGDSIALLGAIFYAGYLMIVRAMGKNVSVGAVMFWATLGATVVSAVLSFSLGEAMMPQTWFGWALVIGLGLLVQICGQGLIAYGVGRLPIVISTVLLWMQPVVAAVLSWILFGEALSAVALLGAALVLAGIFLVQRARA
ncbi:MAG: DMT family transporter [Hyphomonadaceae bacterium]|nr:DMT family transporter [Hyphomonadaceae bacterium]